MYSNWDPPQEYDDFWDYIESREYSADDDE